MMLLQVQSMTDATRLKRLFNKHRIPAQIIQTPSQIRNGGCNLSVKIQNNDLSKAEQMASQANIRILSVNRSGGG